MKQNIGRRTFLQNTLTTAAIAGTGLTLNAAKDGEPPEQEFYELRIYHCEGEKQQQTVSNYLKSALVPALSRLGIKNIGVFQPQNTTGNHPLYMLIPYKTLSTLGTLNHNLAADETYQKAAKDYFAIPKKQTPYKRIESRLMKAFAGMPVIELPAESKAGKPRIFELRIYESHNDDAARRKVEMFNEGEIDIMRKVNLGPVMYGETLISNDVPNLTYMLAAENLEAHKEHWQAFIKHPEWDKMKKIEKYKGTVSKITSVMLTPTDYSQL